MKQIRMIERLEVPGAMALERSTHHEFMQEQSWLVAYVAEAGLEITVVCMYTHIMCL